MIRTYFMSPINKKFTISIRTVSSEIARCRCACRSSGWTAPACADCCGPRSHSGRCSRSATWTRSDWSRRNSPREQLMAWLTLQSRLHCSCRSRRSRAAPDSLCRTDCCCRLRPMRRWQMGCATSYVCVCLLLGWCVIQCSETIKLEMIHGQI